MQRPPTILAASLLYLGLAFLFHAGAQAEENPAGAAAAPAAQRSSSTAAAPAYTDIGADRCIKCHDEFEYKKFRGLFRTKHAEVKDPRTPMAKLQCETCHGPGAQHGDMKLTEDDPRPPIRDFGRTAATPVAEQNGVCLECHSSTHRMSWEGSPHQTGQVACASCHTVHTAHDPAQTPVEQAEVCFGCHTRQRADSYLPSTHPVRYGQLTCTSCHEPHGSLTPALLRQPTLNQTCFQCHAEKRGPFLWEHAPATEDCSTCHKPHGSNHPALLTQRPPQLCQQCHSQNGHASVAYTETGLASGAISPFLLARGCMNCHPQMHGSNHPSGSNLKR